MRLKNKKTGEIATLTLSSNGEELLIMKNNEMVTRDVKLSDLEEWEDYKKPKELCYINVFGEVQCSKPKEDIIPVDTKLIDKLKKIGNYFETKEEAEKAVEKLKAWKRLKDKGFRFNDFVRDAIYYEINDEEIEKDVVREDLDLLFLGGEE